MPTHILTGNLGESLEHMSTEDGESEEYDKHGIVLESVSVIESSAGRSETVGSCLTPSPV